MVKEFWSWWSLILADGCDLMSLFCSLLVPSRKSWVKNECRRTQGLQWGPHLQSRFINLIHSSPNDPILYYSMYSSWEGLKYLTTIYSYGNFWPWGPIIISDPFSVTGIFTNTSSMLTSVSNWQKGSWKKDILFFPVLCLLDKALLVQNWISSQSYHFSLQITSCLLKVFSYYAVYSSPLALVAKGRGTPG